MVDSILATNSPNGSVGVSGWARNADLMNFTTGVVFGFGCNTSGMTVQPVMSGYNVCIAANSNRDRDVFSRNGSDSTVKLTLATPSTPNQGRCYAIVAYKLAAEKATQNNGYGTVHFIAVAGPDTTKYNENPPTEAAIRAAIPSGSTAYICVTATVTVYYGDTALDWSRINNRLYYTSVPVNGSTVPGYQLMALPNSWPVVLSQSKQTAQQPWGFTKWSDGRVEMNGIFELSGSFNFVSTGTWRIASITIPSGYPVALLPGNNGANCIRVANLISSDNGYSGPLYISGKADTGKFGEVKLLDPNGGAVKNPVISAYVRGYWN